MSSIAAACAASSSVFLWRETHSWCCRASSLSCGIHLPISISTEQYLHGVVGLCMLGGPPATALIDHMLVVCGSNCCKAEEACEGDHRTSPALRGPIWEDQLAAEHGKLFVEHLLMALQRGPMRIRKMIAVVQTSLPDLNSLNASVITM